MKPNRKIIIESKLLEKMDEREKLDQTLDWLLSLMNDLYGAISQIEVEGPQMEELLWKVYMPLDRKVDEATSRIDELQDEIDRLYADLLVQEADANESLPPAVKVMLPPCLEQTLFEIRSTPYIMS